MNFYEFLEEESSSLKGGGWSMTDNNRKKHHQITRSWDCQSVMSHATLTFISNPASNPASNLDWDFYFHASFPLDFHLQFGWPTSEQDCSFHMPFSNHIAKVGILRDISSWHLKFSYTVPHSALNWGYHQCCISCHFIHCPIHFHLFPFISVHPSIHSHSLYIFWSWIPTLMFHSLQTLVYTLVLIHVTCPSSRPFQIPFVHDQSVVASVFWICTASRLHSPFFPVVVFPFLFRQLYSVSSSPV